MNAFTVISKAADMTAGAFWSQLQDLESRLRADQAILDADKLRLQRAYTSARNDANKSRGAARRSALTPAIHRNSADRLSHREAIRKYNAAVTAAQKDLAAIGVHAPTLQGLGVAAFIVGAAAVTLLAAAWAAWAINHDNILSHQRDVAALVAQDQAAASIVTSPNATPDQKAAALALMKSSQASLDKSMQDQAPKDPFGISNALQSLVPVLGVATVLAGIVVFGPAIAGGKRGGS